MMFNKITRFTAVLFALTFANQVWAACENASFAAGAGTSGDPWQIDSASDLDNVRHCLGATHTDKHFQMTANIDLGVAPWNTGEGWQPIGSGSGNDSFQGTFNGNGYAINNLTIDRPTALNIGLFGYVEEATIENVTVLNAQISGRASVGTIVGQARESSTLTNLHASGSVTAGISVATSGYSDAGGIAGDLYSSSITNSSAAVTVSGAGRNVGGLIGFLSGSSITQSFASGNVTITSNDQGAVGGLVGRNGGTAPSSISDSFATGNVAAGTQNATAGAGGLIGQANNGLTLTNTYSLGTVTVDAGEFGGLAGDTSGTVTVTNSYWLDTSAGSSAEGESKTATELKDQSTFTGWNFVTDWVMSSNLTYGGYPVLRWQNAHSVAPTPNEIASLTNLVWLAEDSSRWATHYTQTANINAFDTHHWNEGEGWTPLGTAPIPFTGNYDGDGFSIASLFINRGSSNDIGFFSYLNNTTVENLSLENVNVTGLGYVGGLAGRTGLSNATDTTTLNQIFVSGRVTANGDRVGGIAGALVNTSLTQSSTEIIVNGVNRVGGLAGEHFLAPDNSNTAQVSESFSKGVVTGTGSRVGGLIGYTNNDVDVTNTYSFAVTTGDSEVGGLIGHSNSSATVSNSYTVGPVVGNTLVGGLIGSNQEATFTNITHSFWNTETSGQSTSAGGEGKSTDELRQSSTYVGWSISEVTSDYNGSPYAGLTMGVGTTWQIYASYAITYDSGAGTPANSQVKLFDTALTLNGTSSRNGYTFSEWNTASDGSGTAYDPDDSYTANAPLTLYAQWTANNYSIAYDANGGTGTTANSSHTYDTASALTSNGFSRVGYTFAGWSAAANGTGTNYTNEQSVSNLTAADGATVTLYAQWTANTYTITYNANGGTGTTANSSHTYDTASALTSNGFSRVGYSFTGWNSAANGTGTNYTNEQSVSNLTAADGATVTLYAQWEVVQSTLTFNSDGGSSVDAITQVYNSAITTPTPPTRTGFVFAGWSPAIPDTMPATDQTHTAQWVVKTFDVTLTGNAEYSETVTLNYGATLQTSDLLNTPAGYVFHSWNYDDSEVLEDIAVTVTWNAIPSISPIEEQSATQDELFEFSDITAIDPDNESTTVSITDGPSWLSLTGSSSQNTRSKIAGSDEGDRIRDDILATEAFVLSNGAMTADDNGNLYFLDEPRIRVIKPDGTISTLAGNLETLEWNQIVSTNLIEFDGDAFAYPLYNVNDIAVFNGTLYFAQCNAVKKLEDGQITTIIGGNDHCYRGTGTLGENWASTSPSYRIYRFEIDNEGNLFVLDGASLIKFPAGNQAPVALGSRPSSLSWPPNTYELNTPYDLSNITERDMRIWDFIVDGDMIYATATVYKNVTYDWGVSIQDFTALVTIDLIEETATLTKELISPRTQSASHDDYRSHEYREIVALTLAEPGVIQLFEHYEQYSYGWEGDNYFDDSVQYTKRILMNADGSVISSENDPGRIQSAAANSTQLFIRERNERYNGEIYKEEQSAASFILQGTPQCLHDGNNVFELTVTDARGATNTQNLTINVANVNDAPEISDGSFVIAEDATVGDVVGNFAAYDCDNDTLSYSIVSGNDDEKFVVNGAGQLAVNAELNATLNANYLLEIEVSDGQFSSTAWYTVAISYLDFAPEASDFAKSMDEDTSLEFNLISAAQGYDKDFNINANAINITSKANNGTVTVLQDGMVRFEPEPNFFGTATFNFTLADETNLVSNEATATITVNNVNDAPIAITESHDVALNREVNPNKASVTIFPMQNDRDPDGYSDIASMSLVTLPSNGVLYIGANDGDIATTGIVAGGQLTYIPNDEFLGEDSFSYFVTDKSGLNSAVVTSYFNVTLGERPEAYPDKATTNENTSVSIDVTNNDLVASGLDHSGTRIKRQPTNGTVTINTSNSRITYTPNVGYFGSDTFTYTILSTDGERSLPSQVELTILPVFNAPIANDDSASVKENGIVTINVLANDRDEKGNLSNLVTIGTPPQHGSVQVLSNGRVVYTPDASYFGNDSFTYTNKVLAANVNGLDQDLSSTPATVAITVQPLDRDPEPFAISASNGLAVSTLTESEPITLQGIDSGIALVVSEGAEFRMDDGVTAGPWRTGTGAAINGGRLVLRATSSATAGDSQQVTVSVGNFTTTWQLATAAAEYTVNYNGNESTSGTAPAAQTKVHDTNLTLAANSGSLERLGYSFIGWNTSPFGVGTAFDESAIYSGNGPIALYAQWQANAYTLTLNAQGGTVSSASQMVTYQQVIGSLPVPTKDGFYFVGWNTAADGTGDTYTSATLYTALNDLTLYAQFFEEVVFEAPEDDTVTSGQPINIVFTGDNGNVPEIETVTLLRGGVSTTLSNDDVTELLTLEGSTYRLNTEETGIYDLVFVDPISGERIELSFTVNPFISFVSNSQSANTGEGYQVQVVLSDTPVSYPVIVNLAVEGIQGAPSQLAFYQQTGLNTQFTVQLIDDNDGQITLVDNDNLANAVIGSPNVYALQYQAAVLPFVVRATTTQDGREGNVVFTDGPAVDFAIEEPVGATYAWTVPSELANAFSGTGASTSLDPSSLPAGRYDIQVTVTDSSTTPARTSELTFSILVELGCPVGIDCSAIGASGIPTALNNQASKPERLPLCPGADTRINVCDANDANAFIEAPSTYQVRLGALAAEQSWQTGEYASALTPGTLTDDVFLPVGFEVDFEVAGLANAGESVPIALPLPSNLTIPADAVWRKYINEQWFTFVENDKNSIDSAARLSNGACPSVQSNSWQTGLTEGHGCIRLTIEDGGPNDSDGAANGVIKDPGNLAVPKAAEQTTGSVTVTSKSGSFGIVAFATLLLLMLVGRRKTTAWRDERLHSSKALGILLSVLVLGMGTAMDPAHASSLEVERLEIRVTDEQGGVFTDAEVVAVPTDPTQATQNATINADGVFILELVRGVTYQITSSKLTDDNSKSSTVTYTPPLLPEEELSIEEAPSVEDEQPIVERAWPTWYVGAQGYWIHSNVSAADVQSKLDSANIAGKASLDGSGRLGARIYGGAQLNKRFSLELAWLEWAPLEVNIDQVPLSLKAESLRDVIPVSGRGIEFSVIGSQPVSQDFSVYGRLGWLAMQQTIELVFNDNSKNSDDRWVNALSSGAGVTYQWREKIDLRLGADWYNLPNYEAFGLGLGAQYKF